VIGNAVGRWLPVLEARIPRTATTPVGAPAVSSFAETRR